MDPARLVFVGGLHRSGTTALGRVLAAHPEVSGFAGTGAEEEEGQHLQEVYRPAWDLGGPGRFAHNSAAHLTEASEPPPQAAAAPLLASWVPHWDMSRTYLVEKSPPNMVMGRYLQMAFPGSALVVIIRNPVVVALSTKKWTRTTGLPRLMEHWFTAHDLLRADAPHLRRLHVLRYEDLIRAPRPALHELQRFLGLSRPLEHSMLDASRSRKYVDAWERLACGTTKQQRRRRKIVQRFGHGLGVFGYDIEDLEVADPWTWSDVV